jgi:hypothetical protein
MAPYNAHVNPKWTGKMPQITIQGHSFDVPHDPSIVPGTPLDENMAASLQQTRLENIRNNMAARIKRLLNGHDQLEESQLRQIQDEVQRYASEYKFGVRAAGAPRVTRDPVQREMLRLAKEDLAAAYFAKHNERLRGDALNENAQKLIDARHADYAERARRNIRDREAVGEEVLSAAGV